MLFKYSCEEGIVHALYRGKTRLESILTQICNTERQLLLCYFIDLYLMLAIICFQTTVSDQDQNSHPNIWFLQTTTSTKLLHLLSGTSNPSLRGDNIFLTVPCQWDRIMDFFDVWFRFCFVFQGGRKGQFNMGGKPQNLNVSFHVAFKS